MKKIIISLMAVLMLSSLVFAITIDAEGDTEGELITWSNANSHDTWILVRDFGNHLRTAFSVTGAPTTVFINKAGYVTYNIVGLQTSDELNAALVETLEIEYNSEICDLEDC